MYDFVIEINKEVLKVEIKNSEELYENLNHYGCLSDGYTIEDIDDFSNLDIEIQKLIMSDIQYLLCEMTQQDYYDIDFNIVMDTYYCTSLQKYLKLRYDILN